MQHIQFKDLDKWLSKYSEDPVRIREKVAELWEKFHLFPVQCKAAIDEISHPLLAQSIDPITVKCKEELQILADELGVFSIAYQSITKMIIDCELSPADIKRSIKEQDVLPAAFSPSLVAKPSFEVWPIVSFVDGIFDRECAADPSYEERYANVNNLKRFLLSKKRKFFVQRRGVRRLISLHNGSSTRLEDFVNIQDTNGSIYVSEEEVRLIKELEPILDWLKIDNFKETFQFLEASYHENTYGSVNYAPDDSGKVRISFLIDSCLQVISKAVHELLDYMVKDLACNGTYRQQAVIRNMIRKGRHIDKGVILSTDMSKYSDTMQRDKMLEVLRWLEFPEEVLEAMDKLYSLSLWDSVLSRPTGKTAATYQGQYGDFPWITLMNIFNQLAAYDYVNFVYLTRYYVQLKMSKLKGGLISRNDTNAAVGDDTIMAFPKWEWSPEELFEIVKAVFNRVGVNINLSKTHWIHNGEGCCDFVKRFITADGLVPYIRIQSAVSSDLDERCEEMLRMYRDNMIEESEWDELVDMFLPPAYAEPLKDLHILNGGIKNRIIEPSDIKMFCCKNRVYSTMQKVKNQDEIRKWIDMVHKCYQIRLKDTHLISFLVNEIKDVDQESNDEEVLFESEDENDEWELFHKGEDFKVDMTRETREMSYAEFESKRQLEYSSWEEVRDAFSEDQLIESMLNMYTRGYEYPDLERVSRLNGYYLAGALMEFPDFRKFFYDFQQGEIYRYLYSNEKRRMDVYTRMFTEDWSWIIEEDSIHRYEIERVREEGNRHIFSLVRNRAYDKNMIWSHLDWGTEHFYLMKEKRKYRLYGASNSSYDVPPYELFCEVLGYDAGLMSSERDFRTRELYSDFVKYIERYA